MVPGIEHSAPCMLQKWSISELYFQTPPINLIFILNIVMLYPAWHTGRCENAESLKGNVLLFLGLHFVVLGFRFPRVHFTFLSSDLAPCLWKQSRFIHIPPPPLSLSREVQLSIHQNTNCVIWFFALQPGAMTHPHNPSSQGAKTRGLL